MADDSVRSDVDLDELWEEFHTAVNMTSRELQEWLRAASSGPESEVLPDQAHPATGRRVLEILSKRRTDLTDDDVEVMRRVVDIVDAVQPDPETGDYSDARWRHRLMNVGHDPLNAGR